ncbi:P-loop containing nucleoside triphosphate hydrolase protein [Choiromyces venosus 120613-1]|uniref:P-loop containing nucleoside triphosphate hydrolase protein n=1 Tax=Choiromyces venosus 120613-1 TaxID=1336337 RepID=A0A3N4J007_9PEZI|nr:P-loop containing nucleoside triphosphate hydrolase protein [Choiromyces venosus 120613-1]
MPRPPLISITSTSFRPITSSPLTAPTLFPNTTFALHPTQKWSILGSSKSTLLSILCGSHIAIPPTGRRYPGLRGAIELVSFGAGSKSTGMLAGANRGETYLSARYEAWREEFDVSLREWLGGSIAGKNPFEEGEEVQGKGVIEEGRKKVEDVARELKLRELLDQSVMTLSNGQSRRARVAQALLKRPEVLAADEPFMGLDPPSHNLLSELLSRLPHAPEPTQVLLGLRPQDPVPAWSTHIAYVSNDRILAQGPKESVILALRQSGKIILQEDDDAQKPAPTLLDKVWSIPSLPASTSLTQTQPPPKSTSSPIIVQMNNIQITYSPHPPLLQNFSWTIRAGERCGLFGPNGSGKTTLISLLTSDHPQTYALPITHFGHASRLPQRGRPGVSVFDIQKRIGHASPEVHAFFPKAYTLRRTVLSGLAETFHAKPPPATEYAEKLLAGFEDVVAGVGGWDNAVFGEVGLSVQRLALFLRAVVGKRDLIVLDEAFSGMDSAVRDRCLGVLADGFDRTRQALVVVGHVGEEVPEVDMWVRLPERGSDACAVFGEA